MKIYLTFSSLAVELVLLLSHSCWKSSLIHRGISLKGLKMHLNIDQRKLPVFFWDDHPKKPLRSTDVFWFLETFSPLISFAPFALFIRFEKSLQNQKNQWSQRIFWRSPKKKCQVRDLYVNTQGVFKCIQSNICSV